MKHYQSNEQPNLSEYKLFWNVSQPRNFELLKNYTEPGLYTIEILGEPHWWLGMRVNSDVKNIFDEIDEDVYQMVRNKKLRIVIFCGVEGDSAVHSSNMELYHKNLLEIGTNTVVSLDCFKFIHESMYKHRLPPMSVVIAFGDLNVEDHYRKWRKRNKMRKMIEVTGHPGCFQYMAKHDEMEKATTPLVNLSIEKPSLAYNSLNRIFKDHRAAHLYLLKTKNLLNQGIVSCAYVDDPLRVRSILGDDLPEKTIKKAMRSYPRYIDGIFANKNKADHFFYKLYTDTQLSCVTESLYKDIDNVFMSEKTWKPIYAGHPFIFIASNGHLRHLRKLGYKTDFAGIDNSYDDIIDPKERMLEIHNQLERWCNYTQEERNNFIIESNETLVHNMLHYRKTNHFKETINKIERTSERYFHDKI